MLDFSTWDILSNLLLALRWTVLLSLIAFIGGGLLGLLLLVIRLRWRTSSKVSRMLSVYTQVFQGTPLLMQLFLTYFGLALIGLDTSALATAAICLTLYSSAYLSDIWRGCVNAVPNGQWEASTSLALNFGEQLQHIILPQAARIAVAPTVGFLVQVTKGTALASVIGFIELTKAGQMIANATFQPSLIYTFVGLLYFALCFPVSALSRRLERKLRLPR